MLLTEDQASRISPDGLIHDAERLKELVALPLERKIGITTARIIEWYEHWNGNIYVSFSGGKDSTVLLHLVRSIFPDVPAVFSNTGLEYPEIQRFVSGFDNVEVVHPTMRFDEVITKYGYPLISKEVAEAIYYARRITPPRILGNYNKETTRTTRPQKGYRETIAKRQEFQGNRLKSQSRTTPPCSQTINTDDESKTSRKNWRNWRRRCLLSSAGHSEFGEKSMFNKGKWLPIARDLPVLISHKCCDVMKKSPMHKYARRTKSYPYIGSMTEESRMRKQAWIRHGCNAFDSQNKSSQPLSFWTEQDILTYIKLFELDIASVYGDINIVDKKGNVIQTEEAGMPEGCKWQCSKCQRTGCVYCGFGAHNEKGETRFQRLAKTHPRQYEYCIGGGQWADNPFYDPTASMEPDEMGWINWNPKKIWVPSKQGLGLGEVMKMCNDIMGYEMYRWE